MTDDRSTSEPATEFGRTTTAESATSAGERDSVLRSDGGGRTTDGGEAEKGRTSVRGTGGQGPTETAAGAARGSEHDSQGRSVRSFRLGISLTAIFGYVLVFGAAVGAIAILLRTLPSYWIESIDPTWVLGAGALLLPGAAFLFVALYDGAELTRPAWLDGHPPLVDVWLLVFGASGVVAIALSGRVNIRVLWDLGWLAAGTTAFLGLPLWLARRCLRRPSWLIGALSLLLAPLLPVGALLATNVLPLHRPGLAVVVALGGTAIPYGLVAASPDPDRLAVRTIELLRRRIGAARATLGRE